jgi:asparagine synthase (glutamine-hydrolysing)
MRGFELRHPFHDRRLAEFALALPEEQRWRPGMTKFVVREAMRGMLPESIRARPDKSEFSKMYEDVLEAHGGEAAFASLASAEAGWVDAARTRELYREMTSRRARRDNSYLALLWPLWMVLGLEHWLRTVSKSGLPSRQDVQLRETVQTRAGLRSKGKGVLTSGEA